MYDQQQHRETNPHFLPPEQIHHHQQPPSQRHGPRTHFPAGPQPLSQRQPQPPPHHYDPQVQFPRQSRKQRPHQQKPRHDDPNLYLPKHQQPTSDPVQPQHSWQQPQPQPQPHPQHDPRVQFNRQPQPMPYKPQHEPQFELPRQTRQQQSHQQKPRHDDPNLYLPKQQQQPASYPQHPQHSQPQNHRSSLVPAPRKTKAFHWCIAVFCTVFWIIIIFGGLAILIVYLLFRPRSPKFDISTATLNAAYLDMGYLLNADLTLLANFTNPNKKVKVDFSYMVLDLYHEGTALASTYINPFSAKTSQSSFAGIHMVTSQVRLSPDHSMKLKKQMDSGRVRLEIKGLFRTRSNLGHFLRYSYWLYGHCTVVFSRPPLGVLLAKKCTTKR